MVQGLNPSCSCTSLCPAFSSFCLSPELTSTSPLSALFLPFPCTSLPSRSCTSWSPAPAGPPSPVAFPPAPAPASSTSTPTPVTGCSSAGATPATPCPTKRHTAASVHSSHRLRGMQLSLCTAAIVSEAHGCPCAQQLSSREHISRALRSHELHCMYINTSLASTGFSPFIALWLLAEGQQRFLRGLICFCFATQPLQNVIIGALRTLSGGFSLFID